MNKNRLLLILVCLFLVHSNVATSQSAGTLPEKTSFLVSPIESEPIPTFLQEFNVLAFGLGLYHLDAEKGLSKEEIKLKMAKQPQIWREKLNIVFDLGNIDFRKKGFTRYYPFTVNGKDFIIRFFHLKEKYKLPVCQVFYEGVFKDSGIAFQVIPGINTILDGKKIKKLSPNSLPGVSMCP